MVTQCYPQDVLLKPVFKDNYVVIAANSSDEYVPYLSVYLQSIKANASSHTNYDVIIFEQSITPEHKSILKEFFEISPNLSLRFCNPAPLFANNQLAVSFEYLCQESYFRLAAPITLRFYEKVIYTDLDLIFQTDPKQLYDLPMNGAPLLAALEPVWSAWINTHEQVKGVDICKYSKEVLKLSDVHRYFNTGVMLLDIQAMCKADYATKCLEKLASSAQYLYQDQDILNEVLADQMGVLPAAWNYEILPDNLLEAAKAELAAYHSTADKHILHFLGGAKPWVAPFRSYAWAWWGYARFTPFYEQLLERKTDQKIKVVIAQNEKLAAALAENTQKLSILANYSRNYRYWKKYHILSNFCWGKARARYKHKKETYGQKVRQVRLLREEYK